MSLSFNIPSYEQVSTNDAIKCNSTVVNGETVAVWHYDERRPDVSDETKLVRGMVSVGQTMRGFFPMTREIVVYETGSSMQDSVDEVTTLLGGRTPEDLSAITVYEAEEAACLLRVFNAVGEWFVSTNRNLDASTSRWVAPKNFREQFQDSLWWLYTHSRSHADDSVTCPVNYHADCSAEHAEFWNAAPECSTPQEVEEYFFSTLDPEKGYTFLVRPTMENKNFFVTPPPNVPLVRNVGVFTDNGGSLLYNETVLGVPKPARVEHPTESDLDFLSWLFTTTQQGGVSRQGLMVFTGDTHFKLVSHEYHYKSNLRENNTVLFQYIVYNMNVVSEPKSDEDNYYRQRWADFQELYNPVWSGDFDKIDDAFTKVSQELARAYYRRNRPRDNNCKTCEDPKMKCTEHSRDMRRMYQEEFKVVMTIHELWMNSGETSRNGRKRSVFRFPNRDRRGNARSNYQFDSETGMEYYMNDVRKAIYLQDPRNVYKMIMRYINKGDNWTVYQPVSSGGFQNRRGFGQRNRPRFVSKSAPRPSQTAAAVETNQN